MAISISDPVFVLSEILGLVSMSIAFYAAVWAFKIRQALFVRAYKNLALGILIITLIVVVTELVPDILQIFYPFLASLTGIFVWIVSLILLYWINASVIAGRRTDPIQRNTLHWNSLRFVILGLSLVEIISSLVIGTYYPRIFSSPNFWLSLWLFSPLLGTLIVGAVILPVAARRSGDYSLRKHLRWFGLSGIIVVIALPIGIISFAVNNTVVNSLDLPIALIFGALCLYKSVKSLIPLNQLSADSDPEFSLEKNRVKPN